MNVVVEPSSNDVTLPLIERNSVAAGGPIPPIFQNIKTWVKSRLGSNLKNSSPNSSKITDISKSRLHKQSSKLRGAHFSDSIESFVKSYHSATAATEGDAKNIHQVV